MTKRMLIDASHPEETRVVVVSGTRVEEFDYEIASKKPLKGNIYLAKITRVEPSLQAAFVDYGGGRHGFLPFSEIHPDYYRIPIADREALIAEEEELRAAEADVPAEIGDEPPESALDRADQHEREEEIAAQIAADEGSNGEESDGEVEELESETSVDTVGGDEIEEALRRRAKLMRKYKIQEVIKRRQVLLVQVTKEERGTKGAALTTYLSLAGRYCVLMPNTGKGGGISRKIANASDRRRLKEVLAELEIPQGMAVIVRTAGSQRTKAEIRRDYEYLLRLWDEIRTTTLESTAPKLIHEEANLIKRAIRDQYSRDMNEVLVEGDEGYKAAKSFMKMLMPSHARHVKPYKDEAVPLMHKYQVESQLEAMYSTQIRLKSGGSIVINPTEALVAIDVNSGKATKERHIEETALKTNLEAAEEVGRQLRLRDLAGLIVIDFIDMEESRHNRDVERKLKEALKSDRARIQLGRISPFGLLELSRQRLRPSLFETSNEACPTCGGTGFVRSKESSCLQLLRTVTEEAIKGNAENISVRLPTELALYLLNEHRARIAEIEERYGLALLVKVDDELGHSEFVVSRIDAEGKVLDSTRSDARDRQAASARQDDGGEEKPRKRSRRGGRKRKKDDDSGSEAKEAKGKDTQDKDDDKAGDKGGGDKRDASPASEDDEEKKGSRRRRRGKRGGRRRSKRKDGEESQAQEAQAAEQTDDAKQDSGKQDSGKEEPAQDEGGKPAEAAAAEPESDGSDAKGAEGSEESQEESSGDKPAKGRRRAPRKKKEGAGKRAKKSEPKAEDAAEDKTPANEDSAPESSGKPEGESSSSGSESAGGGQDDGGAEQDGSEDSGDQPKRRGWWNRALG
jgi:ribonuclease E